MVLDSSMMNIINQEILKIGDYRLIFGQLLSVVFIIFITFVLSHLVKRSINNYLMRESEDEHVSNFYIISRFLQYGILIAGFMLTLSTLGFSVSKIALFASALGVGIGLGLQNIVNNFISGVSILLEKSVRVGDFIELSDSVFGEVKQIHMRATLIRTNDLVDILVPNSNLVNNIVTNWTLEEKTRRFRIPFSVAYGSDKTLVEKAALEAAKAVPYALHIAGKEPVVWMTGFGDSSLNFVLGVWVKSVHVKRPTAVVSDFLWEIDNAFRKYRIEIPFPQRDLHIRSSRAVLKHQEIRDVK